jgi:hypothetical protein
MEISAAERLDPKKTLIISDETYALVKVLEELTKSIELLATVTMRGK